MHNVNTTTIHKYIHTECRHRYILIPSDLITQAIQKFIRTVTYTRYTTKTIIQLNYFHREIEYFQPNAKHILQVN